MPHEFRTERMIITPPVPLASHANAVMPVLCGIIKNSLRYLHIHARKDNHNNP